MPLVLPQIASLLLTKGVDVGRQAAKQLAGTLAFACLVALTGCSGASEDDVPTTAASTADEPSTEPAQPEGQEAPGPPVEQPVEPVLPVQARGTSVQSAEAFVEYYVALLNHAMVTGDTQTLRAASLDDCSGCADYEDFIDRLHSAGGSYESKGWHSLRILLGGREDDLLFTITATAAPVRYRLSSGARLRESAVERFSFSMAVRKVSEGWAVSDIYAA
jgi:hypothetical protein